MGHIRIFVLYWWSAFHLLLISPKQRRAERHQHPGQRHIRPDTDREAQTLFRLRDKVWASLSVSGRMWRWPGCWWRSARRCFGEISRRWNADHQYSTNIRICPIRIFVLYWWSATIGGRQLLVVGNYWWSATIGGRQLLVVGNYWWSATIGGRQLLVVGNYVVDGSFYSSA